MAIEFTGKPCPDGCKWPLNPTVAQFVLLDGLTYYCDGLQCPKCGSLFLEEEGVATINERAKYLLAHPEECDPHAGDQP